MWGEGADICQNASLLFFETARDANPKAETNLKFSPFPITLPQLPPP